MRSDDRCFCYLHDIPECGVGHMADVDHNTDAIHLSDNIKADVAKAIPLFVFVIG